MKQGFILIFFLVSAHMLKAQAAWQSLGNFAGAARDDASGIVCNGAGYMGTGFGTGFVFLNDWWKYSFETDTWTPKTNLPAAPRQYTAIATIQNDVYLLGGITPTGCTDELWVYHTLNDEWDLLSHFPGGGRQAPVLAAVNGKLYAGLGRCATNYFSDWWMFDLNSLTWDPLTSFPGQACFDPIHAVINESIVVGAGISASGAQNNMYCYDPVFDVWKQLGDFPGCGTFYTVQLAKKNELFVVSGADAGYELCPGYYRYKSGFFDNAWSTWRVNVLAPARRGGVGFLYNNRFYYACGLDTGNNRLNTVQYVDLEESAATGEDAWILYPTVTADFVCIQSRNELRGTLALYNAAGQNIPIHLPAVFSNYLRLDVSALLPGLYLLKITDEQGRQVELKKFVRL